MMRTMRHLLFLIFFYSSFCTAADWQAVSPENGNGTSFFIDMDSVAEDGQFTRAWTMESRKKPKTVTFRNKSVKYQSYVALRFFDCTGGRSAIVKGTFYTLPKGKGDVLHNFSLALTSGLFAAVTPDSMGEALLETACDHLAKRKIQT